MNKVKDKMQAGQAAVGSWLLSGSPVIAEAMAPSFDWMAVDMEHGSTSIAGVEACFRAIRAGGAEPFVRVGDRDTIGLCLDVGASGVIIPNVRSELDAKDAVHRCKYPPKGFRSFSLSRCTGYGRSAPEYFSQANDDIFVAVMIESRVAAFQAQSICLVEGIDAILIGPYDMTGSVGDPGNFKNKQYIGAMEYVVDACEKSGIPYGLHDPHISSKKLLSYYIKNGMKFIAAGMDTTSLIHISEEITKDRKE